MLGLYVFEKNNIGKIKCQKVLLVSILNLVPLSSKFKSLVLNFKIMSSGVTTGLPGIVAFAKPSCST